MNAAPERRAYLAHRFAHGAEEGGAGVLHQMPAICDLESVGKSPAGGEGEAAAAVSGHNSDLRLFCEPRLSGRRFPVRKELDRATALEVANNRPVTLVAFPGPVIDSDDVWSWRRRPYRSPYHAQQRVVTNRHHETPRQARCRSAAERERQMVDEPVEPGGPARVGRKNIIAKPFGKNASATRRRHATEAPRQQGDADHASGKRQIREPSLITAMDAPGNRPAIRTLTGQGDRPRLDDRRVTVDRNPVRSEP